MAPAECWLRGGVGPRPELSHLFTCALEMARGVLPEGTTRNGGQITRATLWATFVDKTVALETGEPG